MLVPTNFHQNPTVCGLWLTYSYLTISTLGLSAILDLTGGGFHNSAASGGTGIDLAGILGTHCYRRWSVGAEWVGVWGGVSPPQPIRGSAWQRRELPQRGQDRAPARNGF